MERVKAMQRNAPAAAEAEPYRPELLAEEEPRYLRRQKPVEIRRKKFGAKSWSFYRKLTLWVLICAVALSAAIVSVRFLLYSPQMLLLKADQIEISGNHIVAREAVQQQFLKDRKRSVVQIPLDARRSAIEELPWVESATVQRILPNRIHVELTERTPIAFLRNGRELALIDAHGVILDRPAGEDLQFPIVTGLSENMPRDEREKRMAIYQEFIGDVDRVRPRSSENVSEVELGDPKNLRVVMTGLTGAKDGQAVMVDFGQGNLVKKYQDLLDNFSIWQAKDGCIASVSLQYGQNAVALPCATASKGK